ncbi:FUSC family protein [Pseudodesulfovibrio senegalensis]|nr:FUSC family protein [Pseudodesulfovibrio senegalensis]
MFLTRNKLKRMTFLNPETNSAHIRHGVKTGLAAMLAYALANLLTLNYGYWAALSAVIVMQVNVADSIRMCWYRFSGTAVGAVIGIVSILAFPETPAMTMAALFCSVAFCAYMTRFNIRYRMAAITVTIVVLASIGQPDRVLFGLLRVLEIGVGVISAFLVSILLWPMRAGTALKQRLENHFKTGAILYHDLLEAFLSLQKGVPDDLLESFNASIASDKELFRKVRSHEQLLYHEDMTLLSRKMQTLEKCSEHLRSMLHTLNNVEGKGYEILMEQELKTLAAVTMEAMQAVGQGECPDAVQLKIALEQTENVLKKLRKEGVTQRFYLQKLIQFFAFYHGIHSMAHEMLFYAHACKNRHAVTH